MASEFPENVSHKCAAVVTAMFGWNEQFVFEHIRQEVGRLNCDYLNAEVRPKVFEGIWNLRRDRRMAVFFEVLYKVCRGEDIVDSLGVFF